MSCDECSGCCALFYSEPCWWMLCCAILYPFSALLCCANMDWPIGYGWQGTVWADRCLGQSCWAGLVLTGGLGWMDPCSRASRGGGPKSRLEPTSETVMRGVMCQDWQNNHTTRYVHRYPVLIISPCLICLFCLSFCLSLQNSPFNFFFVVLLSCTALHTPQPTTFFPSSLPFSSDWLVRLCHGGVSVCMHVWGFVCALKQIPCLPNGENLKFRLWKSQLVSSIDKD